MAEPSKTLSFQDFVEATAEAVTSAQARRFHAGGFIPDVTVGLIFQGLKSDDPVALPSRTIGAGSVSHDELLKLLMNLHGPIFEGITAFLKKTTEERAYQVEQSIQKLHSVGLIKADEADQLRQLTGSLNQTAATEEMLQRVTPLLVDDPNSQSPSMRIILSIGRDSITRGAVAHADVDGAIVGGIFGFELGAFWGAGIGFLGGGAGASIAEAL